MDIKATLSKLDEGVEYYCASGNGKKFTYNYSRQSFEVTDEGLALIDSRLIGYRYVTHKGKIADKV